MNKNEFMDFIRSTATTRENGCLCKVVQNGIIYVLCGNEIEKYLFNNYRNKFEVAGFIYDGKFWGIKHDYREYDLDFYKAVEEFEEKYNQKFKEKENSFTLENLAPITEITKRVMKAQGRRDTDKNINDYKNNYMYNDAKEEIFGITHDYNNSDDKNYEKFAPIFLDCLKNPEKFDDYIQTAIEEKADIINYRLLCNAEKHKKIEELKNNSDLMRNAEIYKSLNSLEAKTVKITCNCYGKEFVLPIEREQLMRLLAYQNDISLYNFTNAIEKSIKAAAEDAGEKGYNAKIEFSEITKITYSKRVIYSEN